MSSYKSPVEKDPQAEPNAAGIGQTAVLGHETTDGPSHEQLELLDASLSLAQLITDQYPQTDKEGKLEYAIAGSLAFMLLAQADSFEVLDAKRIPEIAPTKRVDIPENASRSLKTFARHLGDFDYVQTDQYGEKKQKAASISFETHPEEYEQARKRYLWKGGLQLDGMDDSVRGLLQLPEDKRLFAERVGNFSGEAVKLSVEGRDFYIVDPRLMLAFKAVHLAESFDISSKPEKYVTDMTKLQEALGLIYSPGELAEKTHDTLFKTGSRITNGLEVPYHNPALTEELAGFIDTAIEVDEDAHYLQERTFGWERAIGILKVLHRYDSPEAKMQVLDFINDHWEAIDVWRVNPNSERNTRLIAEHFQSNPKAFAKFRDQFPKGGSLVKIFPEKASAEDLISEVPEDASLVEEWIRSKPTLRKDRESHALRVMDTHEGLDHTAGTSYLLQILMYVDKAKLGPELNTIGQLIDRKAIEAETLMWLFEGSFMQDKQLRDTVMAGFSAAASELDDDQLANFAEAVNQAANPWKDSDDSLQERSKLLQNVLNEYGVKV